MMLDEKTGVRFALLIPLIGFISWLTTIHSLATDAKETAISVQAKLYESEALDREIVQRLARIEGKLDNLK